MNPTRHDLQRRRLTFRFLRATALVARSIGLAYEHVLRDRPELESVVEQRMDAMASRRTGLQARLFKARLERLNPHKRGVFSPDDVFDIIEYGAAARLPHADLAKEFVITEETVNEWHKALLSDQPARKPATPIRSHDDGLVRICAQLADHGVEVGEIARMFHRIAIDLPVENIRRWTRRTRLRTTPPPRHFSPVPTPRHKNHVWMMDITLLRRKWRIGFAHLAVIYDAFSRNPIAACLSRFKPSADALRALIARAISQFGQPVYLLSDGEGMFKEHGLKNYLKRQGIKQRFGKLGQEHSISMIERFWKTLRGLLGRHPSPPIRFERLVQRTRDALTYYSFHRPSTVLENRTPAEAYGLRPTRRVVPIRPLLYLANEQPPELPLQIAWIDGERTLPVLVRKAA